MVATVAAIASFAIRKKTLGGSSFPKKVTTLIKTAPITRLR
jgi:hypothetical protein